MKTTVTNNVKIYDRWSHWSFVVNRNDINVAKTRKWGDLLCVWVHEQARNKTPGYCGIFAVSKKAWNMFAKTDRRTWK